MSLRQRLINSAITTAFGRKLSGPLDRGWGDTLVGPLDPLHESDFLAPSAPRSAPHAKDAPAKPVSLPESKSARRGLRSKRGS